MAISPFGWKDFAIGGTPMDAAHLEAMHAAGGAYTDGLIASAVSVGSLAPGSGNTGDLFLVRSDGTVARSAPPMVDAAAWGCSPSASYTANTTAINSAITAAAGMQSVFGVGVATVRLPAGLVSTSGGHSDGGASVCLRGAGEYRTWLQVNASATTGVDVVTLSGTNSGVEEMTIDGNVVNIASGDTLVFNGPYEYVNRASLYNAGGNGLTVGKASTAEECRGDQVRVRNARGYGMLASGNNSFDGQWSNMSIGNSGKSGVRLNVGAHSFTNVHAWGSGIYSDLNGTDSAGFYLASAFNHFTNCQSETNNSYGIFVNGLGCTWTGGSIWGNYLNGINTASITSRFEITGAQIYRNAVNNTAGGGGSGNYGVRNQSSLFKMTGCHLWDDATAIAATTYSGYTPTFPFPGRTAVFTQQGHYIEISPSDHNNIVGNTMRATDSRGGISYTLSGANSVVANNHTGITTAPTVASAATITLPADAVNGVCKVTGTTQITAITAPRSANVTVTLQFTNAAPGGIANGASLFVAAASFAATQNDSITLFYDGSNWYELSRSGNV